MTNKILSTIIFTLLWSTSYALDVQTFSPVNSTQGGFQLYDAESFKKGRLTLGLYYNFDKHPLEFGLRDTTKVDDIVNDLHTANLLFSYDISRRLSLNFDLPYQYLSDFEGLATEERTQEQSFGDLLVSLPIYLGKISKRTRIKLIPKLVFQTGSEDPFVGARSLNYGLGIAIDRKTNKSRWLLNAEYQKRDKQRLYNLEIGDAARVGVGYNRDIGRKNGFVWINELTVEAPLNVDQNEINTPVEIFTGLRHVSKNENMIWNVGYSKGLNHGYGSPDYRFFAGLNYVFNNKKKPKKVKPTVSPLEIVYLDNIHFITDSDKIKPDSLIVVNEVRDILRKYPSIKLLEITGHTDSMGGFYYNIDLSKRRAASVKRYLVENGIEESRLTTNGFGQTRPIRSNSTREGRYQNRRVDFKILKSDYKNIIFKIKRD